MLILALISTVGLLIWMGFFMLGSLPLLILKHDTPLDARFIRGLFNVYYTAILAIAVVGAFSYALAGRPDLAAPVGCIAAMGFVGRTWFVARMDAVRNAMTAEDAAGIRRFRLLHIAGMVLNVVVLAAFCVGMTKVSL